MLKLGLPVGEFALNDRAVCLLTLPDRIISILDREIRQRRTGTARVRLVESPELLRDETNGPVIGDYMMRRH